MNYQRLEDWRREADWIEKPSDYDLAHAMLQELEALYQEEDRKEATFWFGFVIGALVTIVIFAFIEHAL